MPPRYLCRLFPLAIVAAACATSVGGLAQEAPKPIDVPTTPVPQVLVPYPTATMPNIVIPPKLMELMPKSTRGTPSVGSSLGPSPGPSLGRSDRVGDSPSGQPHDSDGKRDPTRPSTSFNNDGVFRVSGGGASVPRAPSVRGLAQPKTRSAKSVQSLSTVNIAQWAGFQTTADGATELMVAFSKSVPPPQEHRAAGSITYVFSGAHVVKANNRNPLITTHFNTPMMSARLLPQKGKSGELQLVVHFRPGTDAAVTTGNRIGTGGEGQQFFVRFPAGAYLTGTPALATPSPTKR